MNQIVSQLPSRPLLNGAAFPTVRFSMLSDTSRTRMKRIEQIVKIAGRSSPRAIADKTGLAPREVTRFLRQLCRDGVLHLVAKASDVHGARRDALYAHGPEPLDEDGDAGMGFTQLVVSDWQSGTHTRDPMVAAMFGPPRGVPRCVGCNQPQGEPHARGFQFNGLA